MLNRSHLTNEEIDALINESNRFKACLDHKEIKTAQQIWNGSLNLRQWFRGQYIWSIDENAYKRIPDDVLLDHFISTIRSKHVFFFDCIFNSNPRLHSLISALPENQSAGLLVSICESYQRKGSECIISLMQKMKKEPIKQALAALKRIKAKTHCKYLDSRIALLQSYEPPVISRFPTIYPNFFTPAQAAAAPLPEPMSTMTAMPEALPVPELNALTESDMEITYTQTSSSHLNDQPLNDDDLQEWLDMMDQQPGLRMA